MGFPDQYGNHQQLKKPIQMCLKACTDNDGESVAMYAVIQSGGKQHRVKEGQVVRLEKIDLEKGATVDFDKILMVGEGEDLTLGAPYLDKAKVSGEIVEQGRGKKIKIIKFQRRKHSRKQMGHRQWFTEVKITSISK
jgi:large subunit ribosomal protein L21